MFVISEFLWYGYWAGDPSAVADYIDTFYDNNSVHHEMVFLFLNKLRKDEGHWFEYLKSAIEPLCVDHGNLVKVFCTFCVIAPDEQRDFDTYDELLKTYLAAADEVLPQKLAVQLHQKYADWYLTSDLVREDMTKLLDGLRSLEEASLKAAEFFDPKEDWKILVSYLADALYAQTMLCNFTPAQDFEYGKGCFERATETFDRLGDDGARHLIETRHSSFLVILKKYFVLYLMVYGTGTSELSRKIDSYIEIIENQSQTQELMSVLFQLYHASLKVLLYGREPSQEDSDHMYIPDQKDDEIFACEKKLVELGDTLYPRMLRNGGFVDTYLESLIMLTEEQSFRLQDFEATQTRKKYIRVVMNLHDNKLMSDVEVGDSNLYTVTLDFVKYELGENAENWEEIIDYLDQMIEWLDACRPDALSLSIRQAESLLLKVKYSALAESNTESNDETKTKALLHDAFSLILRLPEQLASDESVRSNEKERREGTYNILDLFSTLYMELIRYEMTTDAKRIAETFREICLSELDYQSSLEELECSHDSQLSEGYHLVMNARREERRRVSKDLIMINLDLMEVVLEPHHTMQKEQLSEIREAVQAKM